MISAELATTIEVMQVEAHPLRIVALGTSHTARGGWQRPLADALKTCLGRPVDVINHGKSGANSQWGLGQVPQVAAASPDIVLIEFGANDAALHSGVSEAASRANITAMVRELRSRVPGVRIILMAMNPMHGLRGVLRPWLDDYYDMHRALAAVLGVEFVDHRPAWLRMSADDRDRVIPDGAHPDAAAAAGIVVPALADLICGKRTGARGVDRVAAR